MGHSPAPGAHKSPHRQGPLQASLCQPLRPRFRYGGNNEETAWALARARFDAETFWYRGNGSADIVTDKAFLDRVGLTSSRTATSFSTVIPRAMPPGRCFLAKVPVQVRQGPGQIGRHTVSGDDLPTCSFSLVPASEMASVGVVSGTGLMGLRLTERLPYFTSGVAYPDCMLLKVETWAEGHPVPDRRGLLRPGLGRRIRRVCLDRVKPRILVDRPGFRFPPGRLTLMAASEACGCEL